jgi:NADPH-dependent ferric siderophore reductase
MLGVVSPSAGSGTATRGRREPPQFRLVAVRRVDHLTPRMARVTLTGADLEGFALEDPGASVRLLLPSPGASELVVPTWNGNEFLLPNGRRPTIRTFTPRRSDPEALELDVEIVVHGRGVASRWAEVAEAGHRAAVSGPGRGYAIVADAPGYLLGGDETAIPAISQLLEALPPSMPAQVYVEIVDPGAMMMLTTRPEVDVRWCPLPTGGAPGDALVAAVTEAQIAPDTRVWVAGEAAGVQRIRRHLFEERGWPRSQASVRGYWKHGRSGDDDE